MHGLPTVDYFDVPTSMPLTFTGPLTSHALWIFLAVMLLILCFLLHFCCRHARPSLHSRSFPKYAPAAPSPTIELAQCTAPLRSESPPPSANSPGLAADQSTATSPALHARTSVRAADRLPLFSVPVAQVRVTSRSHTLASGAE